MPAAKKEGSLTRPKFTFSPFILKRCDTTANFSEEGGKKKQERKGKRTKDKEERRRKRREQEEQGPPYTLRP